MNKQTITREVAKMVIISPPVLGAPRLKYFLQHLKKCKSLPPPPTKIIGVNKDHLDFSDCDCGLLARRRGWWTETKLRIGWEPYAINFQEQYSHYFELGYRHSEKDKWVVPKPDGSLNVRHTSKKASSGVVACAISHILAWEYIVETLDDDQVAMIIEDDVMLDTHRLFNQIRMPSEADILHFVYPGPGTRYLPHSEDFLREDSAFSAQLYFVTKQGVQKLLSELLPIPIGRAIDMVMFTNENNPRVTYKVFTEAEQVRNRLTIHSGSSKYASLINDNFFRRQLFFRKMAIKKGIKKLYFFLRHSLNSLKK